MGKQKFSRSLKRSICIEYMQSGKSRKEIAMKYNLPSVGTLSGWIHSCLSPLEIHEKCASLPPVTVQMDSAIAERVNGILKTEVIYREKRFKTYRDALERISSFIVFYNETRPHSSIGMKTPSEAHKEQGPQHIMWKPAGTLSGAVCPLPLGTP